jgi:hypothetical protein
MMSLKRDEEKQMFLELQWQAVATRRRKENYYNIPTFTAA